MATPCRSSAAASTPAGAPRPVPSRSIKFSAAEMRTSISGWRSIKVCKRGSNHRAANDGATATSSRFGSTDWRNASTALANCSNPRSRPGNKLAPCGESAKPLAKRRNRAMPSSSSNAFTWWLTAAGVTCSSAAAFLKLLWRAAATKARNALTDGRREFTSVATLRPSFSNARSITSRLLQRSRRNSMCSR